ncbi:MAG: hypothetical protein ACRC4T_18605 [Cetobacterium sp.]
MKKKSEEFFKSLNQEEIIFFTSIKNEYLNKKKEVSELNLKENKLIINFKPLYDSILDPNSVEAHNYIRDKNEKLEKFLKSLQEKKLVIFHVNYEDYQFIVDKFGFYCLENFEPKKYLHNLKK